MVVSLAQAQKISQDHVPEQVKATFQKQYPEVQKVKWEKDNGNYEAEFEIGQSEVSMVIDSAGGIVKIEEEIGADALPKNTKDYLTKQFPGKKVKEATKTTDGKGVITYEVEVGDEELVFDGNGNFVKEEDN